MEYTDSQKFVEEIATLATAAPADSERLPFLDVLHDFTRGLERSGVGAQVRRSDDRNRYVLVLWPPYRPAWRTQMLSFTIRPTAVVVHQAAAQELTSIPTLQDWLRDFVGKPEFKSSLQTLRDEGNEPVEARLLLDDAPDLLVEVSPEHQKLLATNASEEVDVTVQLEPGDQVSNEHIRKLQSAGIERDVVKARSLGRKVELTLAPCA